jgi:hypothetical protein
MAKTRLLLSIGVVLVVLGLAAAIVLPRLLRVREQDGIIPCLSRLKQQDFALALYAQDFGGRYPWRLGATDRGAAWRDLAMLFPSYDAGWRNFFCPVSNDRPFEPKCASGDKKEYPFEPLLPTDNTEVTSYAYCYDGRTTPAAPWTEDAPSGTRLLADKKAGLRIARGTANPPSKVARHFKKRFLRRRLYGRYVAYNDGHVQLEINEDALDPNPTSDALGPPGADNYTAWWSDPPFYGE